MPQRQVRVDLIAIPPAGTDALQVLACLEVGDNALDRALVDPNLCSDLAKRRLRVARNGQEDISMIAEKCPARTIAVCRFQLHGLTRYGIRDKKYTTGLSFIKLANLPSRAELEAANRKARRKRARTIVPSAAWALAAVSFDQIGCHRLRRNRSFGGGFSRRAIDAVLSGLAEGLQLRIGSNGVRYA
jgi:hypothetical protein